MTVALSSLMNSASRFWMSARSSVGVLPPATTSPTSGIVMCPSGRMAVSVVSSGFFHTAIRTESPRPSTNSRVRGSGSFVKSGRPYEAHPEARATSAIPSSAVSRAMISAYRVRRPVGSASAAVTVQVSR